LVLTAATAAAQKPAVLFGVVTNLNGVRLSGVEMTIANTPLRVVTDDSGQFIFEAPPTGRVHLAARRIGFRPADHGFKIDVGASKQEDFELEGLPDLLDSVHVIGKMGIGRMAEFWNRRMIGVGAFLTRDQIERRGAYRPSDLLRTVNGVRVSQDQSSGRPVIQMGRTPIQAPIRKGSPSLAAVCQVNYYLDGSWVAPGTFHIDDLSPTSIEAIEIYRGPAEIPPRFRQRETACGLIVIWTREGGARDAAEAEHSSRHE
jgi:carboxypeptidase family protein/TonB-dependent receptor-like protein